MAEALKGTCLCGAVRITARAHEHAVSACHCSLCRRWTGSALWCIESPADAVTVEGPVRRYRSSSFAERAWCETCGSHLWIRTDGDVYDFVPGLFEGARDIPLDREVYADLAMASVALAGDHARLSRAEYEARNQFVEDTG